MLFEAGSSSWVPRKALSLKESRVRIEAKFVLTLGLKLRAHAHQDPAGAIREPWWVAGSWWLWLGG